MPIATSNILYSLITVRRLIIASQKWQVLTWDLKLDQSGRILLVINSYDIAHHLISELHWHKTAEVLEPNLLNLCCNWRQTDLFWSKWAYVIKVRLSRSALCTFLTVFISKGTTQITSVDSNGRNYIANAVCQFDFTKFDWETTTDSKGPGDLWYFPAGIPHSLQATDDDPDGSEFVLVRWASHKYYPFSLNLRVKVFPDGAFSDESTFMASISHSENALYIYLPAYQLTDWLSHVPAEGKLFCFHEKHHWNQPVLIISRL